MLVYHLPVPKKFNWNVTSILMSLSKYLFAKFFIYSFLMYLIFHWGNFYSLSTPFICQECRLNQRKNKNVQIKETALQNSKNLE